jgi:hypothetical protein
MTKREKKTSDLTKALILCGLNWRGITKKHKTQKNTQGLSELESKLRKISSNLNKSKQKFYSLYYKTEQN